MSKVVHRRQIGDIFEMPSRNARSKPKINFSISCTFLRIFARFVFIINQKTDAQTDQTF